MVITKGANLVERGISRAILTGALGVAVVLVFTLIADGDLDFGQRDAPPYYAVALSLSDGQGLTVPFGSRAGPSISNLRRLRSISTCQGSLSHWRWYC